MSELTTYRIVKAHLKRPNWHEWVTLGETERRSATGKKVRGYGNSYWLVYICNNTECNARAVVNCDRLCDELVDNNE